LTSRSAAAAQAWRSSGTTGSRPVSSRASSGAGGQIATPAIIGARPG